MSLIAHYPLINDLKDYSGNGNDLEYITSDGQLTNVVAGKMGKCYKRSVLNGGDDYFRSKRKINLQGRSFALMCWANVNTIHAATANGLVSNHDHYRNAGPGLNIADRSGMFRISCSTGDGSSRTYHSHFGTSDLNNKWAHLVMRYNVDTKECTLFVNGVIEKTFFYNMYCVEDYIGVFTWSVNYHTTSYKPICSINDVRVYNHFLSDDEVKEISKARVLHYSFNDPYEEYTKNLAPNPITWIQNQNSTITKIGNKVKCVLNQDTSTPGMYMTLTLKANTKYTVSAKIGGNAKVRLTAYENGTHLNTDTNTSFTHYYGNRCENTFTTKSITTIRIYAISFEMNINDHFSIEDFQIEEKDHATPYTLGERKSMIADNSGFGHHTTMNNPATSGRIAPFSSTGSHSLKLEPNENTDRINVFQAYPAYDEATLCAKIFYVAGRVNDLENIIYNSVWMLIYDDGRLYTHVIMEGDDISFWTDVKLIKNAWSHIAIRVNSNEVALFINGVKSKSVSNNGRKISNVQGFYIGTESTDRRTFNGYVDNVELFATALSDEEMLNSYGVNSNKMKFDLSNNHIVISEIIERENLFDTERIYTLGQTNGQESKPQRAVIWGVPCIGINPENFHDGSGLLAPNTHHSHFMNIIDDAKPNTRYLVDLFICHAIYYNGNPITSGFQIWYTDGTYENLFYKNTETEGRWRRHRIITDAGKTIQKMIVYYNQGQIFYVAPQSKVVEYDDPWISDKGELVCSEFIEHKAYVPNLLDYSNWKELGKGGIDGWTMYGATNENERMIAGNPYGDLDYMWVSPGNDADSNQDGGFNDSGPRFAIDKTKKYRVSIWIRKEKPNTGNDDICFGLAQSQVTALGSTTVHTNPYFYRTKNADVSNWMLWVGFIHPHTHTGTTHEGKIYKKDGSVYVNTTDWKWKPDATLGTLRSFMVYCTDPEQKAYFYRPRFEISDGSEPSIQDLLLLQEHSSLIYADDDAIHIDEYGNIICNTFNEE